MIKLHGMQPEKASRVKRQGHKDEIVFAKLINGKRVPGQHKTDVVGPDGKKYTVKSGSETQGKKKGEGRWQLFLLSASHFDNAKEFPASALLKAVLGVFPKSHREYQNNKNATKTKVAKIMMVLKDWFASKANQHLFFRRAIFNDDIDFLVIYDAGTFHIFDREEVLDIFDKSFVARNSKGIKRSVGAQKVVFDYQGKLTIELEVRTTDDGKYPSLLLVTNKSKILEILLDEIAESEILRAKIRTWGRAISKFRID